MDRTHWPKVIMNKPRQLYSGKTVEMIAPSGRMFSIEIEAVSSLLGLGWFRIGEQAVESGSLLESTIFESD